MTTPWPALIDLADKHLSNATSGERLALVADVVALLEPVSDSVVRYCHCGATPLALIEQAIFMDRNHAMAHTATECFRVTGLTYARRWATEYTGDAS